jgi:UDP-N-acetylglucosamine transferase subunit ALG13
MILVTVGSDRYPFDRLVRAVEDTYVKHGFTDEIVFQYGSCTYVPAVGRAAHFMPFREMRALIEGASIVVTHGGVGSVGLCLGTGKKPIVLPRMSSLAEAIDDHQVAYAEHMAKEGYIHWARSAEDIEGYLVGAISTQEALAAQLNIEERRRLCAFLERACVGRNI